MSGHESDRTASDLTAIAHPALGPAGARHAFLLVLSGPQTGDVFPLASGRALLIGRREDADVPIRDEGVSRRHATIEVGEQEARLVDLESANGTFVDGARVRDAALANGARIAIGGATLLKFVWTDEIEARWQLRLSQSARQDPLTGLFNRRHLEERLGAELAAALRHGRPVALLLGDLDHFKAVNDRHGHLAGDELLRLTALVLQDAVRKEDVLARHGGEEFAVLARETTLAGGRFLAERLRSAVERSRCVWREGVELAVTISIGVAVSARSGSYLEGESERTLFAWADRALYLAKERRNAVVALEAEEQRPTRS
jgi:diguanylate cyclase (GGDEF)-like protein